MNARLAAFSLALTALAASADTGRTWDVALESLRAEDIRLGRASTSARILNGPTEATVTAAHSVLEFDYRPAPFDFRGVARTRRERTSALRLAGSHRFAEIPLTLLAAAGGYRGYTGYRNAWLDEYYRQQYAGLGGTPGLDTYREAAPTGRDFSFGARWEYVPGSAFVQLSAGHAQDRTAPGYEIDFTGLRRGPDTLATVSATLAFENVLSPRLRSRLELRTADTSGRETRFGGEAELRAALGETWIARGHVGGASERPTFASTYGGLAIERTLGAGLAAFVAAKHYRDTGEIENALLFSSAAPALRSRSWSAGVRRDGDRWTWRLEVTRLRGRHAPTNPNTDFFRHLYADRTWLLGQAAVALRF